MISATLLIIVIVLFLLGLAGTIIPALPGTSLIFVGILIHAIATNFAEVSITATIVFGLVALASVAVSYAGSMLGAKAGGGKAWSVGGTVLGGVVGTIVFGPLGLLVGAFLGALAGALYEGQSSTSATKAAFYSVLGIIGGTLIQLLIGLSMIVAWVALVI